MTLKGPVHGWSCEEPAGRYVKYATRNAGGRDGIRLVTLEGNARKTGDHPWIETLCGSGRQGYVVVIIATETASKDSVPLIPLLLVGLCCVQSFFFPIFMWACGNSANTHGFMAHFNDSH